MIKIPNTIEVFVKDRRKTQDIDDFDQSQTESKKKKLDTIHEYLLYIMSPFVYEDDMYEFCTGLLKFATDHNYRPKNEWIVFIVIKMKSIKSSSFSSSIVSSQCLFYCLTCKQLYHN